jgi:hypothetical protein
MAGSATLGQTEVDHEMCVVNEGGSSKSNTKPDTNTGIQLDSLKIKFFISTSQSEETSPK